jgi:hypothetical protein
VDVNVLQEQTASIRAEIPKMEAVCFLETFVSTDKSTWCYYTEDEHGNCVKLFYRRDLKCVKYYLYALHTPSRLGA